MNTLFFERVWEIPPVPTLSSHNFWVFTMINRIWTKPGHRRIDFLTTDTWLQGANRLDSPTSALRIEEESFPCDIVCHNSRRFSNSFSQSCESVTEHRSYWMPGSSFKIFSTDSFNRSQLKIFQIFVCLAIDSFNISRLLFKPCKAGLITRFN